MIYNIKKFLVKKKNFFVKIKKLCLYCFNYNFLKCKKCFYLNRKKIQYLLCKKCFFKSNLICNNKKRFYLLIFIKKKFFIKDEFFLNYKDINSKILNKIIINFS